MREKGVLCLPWGSRSDSGRFHYCCHLNKSTTGMTCNLVQSTIYGWIYALLASVFFVIIFIALYLPAVICLPSLPRVSGGGVRCIVLEDPSPAALQSLIAKAFSRPNPASLQDKTRLFFLKTITYCILVAASMYILGFNLSKSFFYTTFGVLMGLSTLEIIFDIVMPCTPPYLCGLCDGEFCRHWGVSDAVREHMDRTLLIIRNQCHKFCTAVITRICFRPSFESPVTAIWSVCRVFLCIVLVPFAIVGIPLGCTYIFLFLPFLFSPSVTVLTYNRSRFVIRFQEFLPSNRSWSTKIGSNCFGILFLSWTFFLMVMAIATLYVIGVRVGFLAIAAIDFADISCVSTSGLLCVDPV